MGKVSCQILLPLRNIESRRGDMSLVCEVHPVEHSWHQSPSNNITEVRQSGFFSPAMVCIDSCMYVRTYAGTSALGVSDRTS